MFENVINKLSKLGDHHQLLFTIIAAISIICISWGIERILHLYLFPNQPLYAALTTIAGGVILLWLTKHVILHVI